VHNNPPSFIYLKTLFYQEKIKVNLFLRHGFF